MPAVEDNGSDNFRVYSMLAEIKISRWVVTLWPHPAEWQISALPDTQEPASERPESVTNRTPRVLSKRWQRHLPTNAKTPPGAQPSGVKFNSTK
jgi:hypothetical protein